MLHSKRKSLRKERLIAVVGPTASGKSEFAVRLAKKLDGEIISADSRQVYKYLDIGSNKVLGKWKKVKIQRRTRKSTIVEYHNLFLFKNIVHHCIDFVNPKRKFTVVDFKKCAERAIKDIAERGKIPILAGGTGFYVSAVIDNAAIPKVPPNWKLRKALEKKTAEELFAMVKKLDKRRASVIEPKNKRRLIRAIEIVKATGKPVPKITEISKEGGVNNSRSHIFDALRIIGIKVGRQELQKRIKRRTKRMLKRGLITEVRKLKKIGLSSKRIGEFGFEYRYPLLYLEKKITKKELENALNKENWRYAKRQMTWFKRDRRTKWKKI